MSKKEKVKVEKATFAGGCFWGVEVMFGKTKGVVSTKVGYTGGTLKNPTYEDVCADRTGHAEAVEIEYDPSVVSCDELLGIFFQIHDPTTPNRQGPDKGSQYRSAIFFHNKEQEAKAKEMMAKFERQKIYKNRIVTEIKPASEFYIAEEYHQKYHEKKGDEDVCLINNIRGKILIYNAKNNIVEKQEKVAKTDKEWAKLLTPEQYSVTRQKGTERPFTNACAIPKEKGIYECVCCGIDLFDYGVKFESGTGWPSFYKPVSELNVQYRDDYSHSIHRIEALCARCDAHLGHIFDDGPFPTHKRYCINSVAIKLAE